MLCYVILQTCHGSAEEAYKVNNKYTIRHFEVNRDFFKLQMLWEIIVFIVRILDSWSQNLTIRSPLQWILMILRFIIIIFVLYMSFMFFLPLLLKVWDLGSRNNWVSHTEPFITNISTFNCIVCWIVWIVIDSLNIFIIFTVISLVWATINMLYNEGLRVVAYEASKLARLHFQ